MFKPGGLFGPKPGKAALDQAMGGSPSAGSSGGSSSSNSKDDKKGGDEKGYGGSGFDPRGLERAAKAAKVLNESPNASIALDLIKQQEVTKAAEHRKQEAEYAAYVKQMELQRVEQEAEAARKTLGLQTEEDKKRAQFADELERKRQIDQLEADRYLRDEEMRKQEELTRKQEAVRRKTLEYEAELRQQTELARVKAETEGKIRQERENHDLRLEEAREGAKEYRDTVLEAIKLAGDTLGTGMQEFLSDKDKMVAATATLTAMALGIYTARTGTGVAGRYIEARLGKPSLVRETSRRTLIETVRNPIPTIKRAFGMNKVEDALSGVVLEKSLEARLSRVAQSTFNTKRNNAPFRHLLLYGPPGTGKTLFAKGLARHSGLEYAIMTGGDIAPLGRDAVTEMHKVFDWAQASRKGLLLFVDEADAFLRRRNTETISEDLRNALNAFLYRTGESTDKFMLVYASNQPEQFDWAVNDRIDEMVPFDLPGREERLRMVNLYMKNYLLEPPGKAKVIRVDGIEDSHLEDVADLTEGFSGREIAKLAIAWQAAAYGTPDSSFDTELMTGVLEAHLQQKRQKQAWLEGAQTSSGGIIKPPPPRVETSPGRMPPRLVRALTQDAEGGGSGKGNPSGKPRGTS
ncbi:unnamed protein product [Pylaiella littoralis]